MSLLKLNALKKSLSKTGKLIAVGSITFLIAFFSMNINAGAQFVLPVVIGANSFSGNFGSTRNSANAVELLYVVDNGASITIVARDAAGNTASCVTANAVQMATLRDLTDSSYLRVTFDDNGQCTSVSEIDGSVLEPPV